MVITSLFELIIPKGNLKKYIKIVLGLYVVFSIISPFVNSNALYDIKEDFKIKNEIAENQIVTSQKSMDNRLQILYVDELKKDITKKIEENGYKIQSINVDANLNADGVDPGIHKIYLSLTKKQVGIEDINKVEIVCFNTGICFLLMKTVLDTGVEFADVLNFNYKFRDIQSKIGHPKEYDNIKIQTQKFDNMQRFSEFLVQLTGKNIEARKINLDTDRLITYSYTCLDQESWNETTDMLNLEKEFEKYRSIKPANEQVSDVTYQRDSVYKEKYLYYGFANNSTVLLTSEANIQNYNELLFEYENSQLYHFIYYLHQKVYLNKLNYEIKQARNFENIKSRFITFAKEDWIYEITNNLTGAVLDKYYRKELKLDETFIRIKSKYDLLYKDYEVNKTNKHNNWLIVIIGFIIIIGVIKLLFKIGG